MNNKNDDLLQSIHIDDMLKYFIKPTPTAASLIKRLPVTIKHDCNLNEMTIAEANKIAADGDAINTVKQDHVLRCGSKNEKQTEIDENKMIIKQITAGGFSSAVGFFDTIVPSVSNTGVITEMTLTSPIQHYGYTSLACRGSKVETLPRLECSSIGYSPQLYNSPEVDVVITKMIADITSKLTEKLVEAVEAVAIKSTN